MNQKKSAWQHTPELPINYSPIFDWPQSAMRIVTYFFGTGFLFSQRTVYAIVAVVAWLYFMPELSAATSFAWGWVGTVALVLLVINLAYGWGYHWLFWLSDLNSQQCKFDKRALATNSDRFLFGNQLWDNVFLSLTSGLFFTVFYMCGFMWLYANNAIMTHTWSDGWLWYLAVFAIVIWWSSFHFYVVHRLMHEWQWLYDKVHALHHKNINIGPWSGMAMHPVEHVIYLSSVMLHLVIPSDSIHVLFHLIYLVVGAYWGHIGYEGFYVGNKQVVAGGNFFHQLHHRYFDCNYGTGEMPWDKWFGSFHSGTEEDTLKVRSKTAGKA